jgi:MFS family permease
LDLPLRALRGDAYDRPRRHGGERGAAVDPGRPRFLAVELCWVVNAYLIAFGGLLLLAGRLGDLVSRRGVFLFGLCVFVVASLLCGMAQSQGMLVAARFVQGAAAR